MRPILILLFAVAFALCLYLYLKPVPPMPPVNCPDCAAIEGAAAVSKEAVKKQ